MADREFKSFEEFWPFYVKEHQKQATRVLHFLGTTVAMGCVAGGLLTKRRWLLAVAPFAGYGPAWFSHFFIEGNRPASWKYPVWSFKADFVMWSKMVRFQMSDEVERVLREDREREEREREESVHASAPAGSPSEVVN
jgi:hypothetical protein